MDQFTGPARLEIDAAYYNALDIRSFALMLNDPKKIEFDTLMKNMLPGYDSARRQGYEIWSM